jgi:hypothetical protein
VGDEPDTDRASSRDWPICAQVIEPGGQECSGVRVGLGDRCWAHLAVPELKEALGYLEPGGELDLRGTSLSVKLLSRILAAMRDPGDGKPRIGNAQFDGATFIDDSSFEDVIFSDRTSFDGATFAKDVSFEGTTFGHYAAFHNAVFKGWADFYQTKFGQVTFARSEFAAANFEGKQSPCVRTVMAVL